MIADVNEELFVVRQDRLRSVMRAAGVPAILTADPINIIYGCGVRNMTVFGMMGPSRFLLLFAEGPSILFEFAGWNISRQAWRRSTRSVRRRASRPTPVRRSVETAARFAAEISSECRRHIGDDAPLGVERVDFVFTDELRAAGMRLADATGLFVEARRIKQMPELRVMREAIGRVEHGVGMLESAVRSGDTEVEVWAAFHHDLIAMGGSTCRPGCSKGARTRSRTSGRLAIGRSPTVSCCAWIPTRSGTAAMRSTCPARSSAVTDRQPRPNALYTRAYDQLQHNAALLAPGRRYEDFARQAWVLREEHRP